MIKTCVTLKVIKSVKWCKMSNKTSKRVKVLLPRNGEDPKGNYYAEGSPKDQWLESIVFNSKEAGNGSKKTKV